MVSAGVLQADASQEDLAAVLQDCFERLTERSPAWRRWFRRAPPISGLYIHGAVGCGKTMLMDLLVAGLESAGIPVLRIHFHRFMDQVHADVQALGRVREPLSRVAAGIAKNAKVLCFDEFHVSDIGDAMILGELLTRLFEREVTLVATSNSSPDDLYAGGLQRARFLPAIDRIRMHCRVYSLDGACDYRLRELVRHPLYYTPVDDGTMARMSGEFQALAAGERVSTAPLTIRGRELRPRQRAGSIVWFDFRELCDGPRSAVDYIELARRFSTLLVSGVPVMDDRHNDAARRFVHFIDVSYDRAVKLILSAESAADSLYRGKRLEGPYRRTVSRLIEMQSRDYLAKPHRP